MQINLSTLEPGARKLAETAAVAGRPIPLDVAAALIGESPEATLTAGERLMESEVLEAAGDGFAAGPGGVHPEQLSSVRTIYLYRELADAYLAAGYGERTPRLLGEYLLKAGDAEAAVVHIDAATTGGSSVDMIELVEAGVAAIEEQGIDVGVVEGRLRLERAKYHQLAGASDEAAADLRAATRLLDGASLVDALGFMAAVEDNRQESQIAEVYAAAGIAEATAIGEPVKAGSLLLLHARILDRIGFPAEADACLERGVGILEELGNPYQRFLATQNMARIALDRGRAARAEPLFQRVFATAEDVGGRAALADAAAWLARAQFLGGHPDSGLESLATAIELAKLEALDGPLFLAHMAHAEGAARFVAHPEALEAADAMLEQVLLHLPDWENAARSLRSRALLGLGRLDEAAAEIDRALAATPEGINGWRWRLRIEALSLTVLAAQGKPWPLRHAEDLTDELLQGLWLDVAAELLALRARVEGDPDLARQAAALALELGIPTTAADAIEAAGLWQDPAGTAVAARIKGMARRVPPRWWQAWSAQPAIAAALAAPDVVDEELAAAAAALQEELDIALTAAGLAEGATPLSPAQRRQQGMVRRKPGPVRRTAGYLAAGAAVVVLAIAGGAIAAVLLAPDDDAAPAPPGTTAAAAAIAMEERHVTEDLPEFFAKTWQTLGGDPGHTGATIATGVKTPDGYYWRNDESQSPFQGSPIVIGQNVVVGARDGQVYFMSQRDGTVAKVGPPGGSVEATAAGAAVGSEYRAYVANGDGLVYAYNVQTGGRIGQAEVDTCCTPVYDEARGMVYVADRGGVIHAFGPDLEPQWSAPATSVPPTQGVTTAMAFDGSRLFYAMGSELWQFDVDSQVAAPCGVEGRGEFFTPVVSDGVVYAMNTDRFIHILDAATCTTGEDFIDIRDDPLAMPAVAGNLIIVPHLYGVSTFVYGTQEEVAPIVAMDPDVDATGSTRRLWWRGPIKANIGAVRSPPVYADGIVYIGSSNGNVYALEFRNHQLEVRWDYDAGAQIVNSVAVTDKVVYVATTAGRVIAIAPVAEERLAG